VVEVAVCDEDNVGIVSSVSDVVRVGVNNLSFVNADTALFVYGYEIKCGETSLWKLFFQL